MSGKHRRPEADLLPDADVAQEMVAGPVIEASASALSGPTVVARTSRQAQRRARRQSQRRQVSLIAGVVVVVLVVAVGGWWLLGRGGGGDNAERRRPAEATHAARAGGRSRRDRQGERPRSAYGPMRSAPQPC